MSKIIAFILALIGFTAFGVMAGDMVAVQADLPGPPIQVAEMADVDYVHFVVTVDAKQTQVVIITQGDTIVVGAWGSDINQTHMDAVAVAKEWPKEVDAYASSLRPDYSNTLTSITAEQCYIEGPGEGHAVYPLLYHGDAAYAATITCNTDAERQPLLLT